MPPAWNIEWLNLNANRAYPLKEDSQVSDLLQAIEIPAGMIVDFVAVVPSTVNSDLYVSRIIHSTPTLTVLLGAGGSPAASITVSSSSHNTNDAYQIVGQGDYADMRGTIAFGDLKEILKYFPQGTFDFAQDAVLFEPGVIRPEIRGVETLAVRSAQGAVSEGLGGVVELIEGQNIRITVVQESTPDQPAIVRIDSIATDLEEECVCDEEHTRPDPIRTVNGVAGDDDGNLLLIPGETCTEIVSGGSSTLVIRDTCCQPCCGCPEQEFLTSNMTVLRNNQDRLNERTTELEFKQDDFFTKVLTSLS